MLSLYLLQVFLSQNALGQKKTIQETGVLKLAVFPQKMQIMWEYLLWKTVIKFRSNEEESHLNTHSWKQAFFFFFWNGFPSFLPSQPLKEFIRSYFFHWYLSSYLLSAYTSIPSITRIPLWEVTVTAVWKVRVFPNTWNSRPLLSFTLFLPISF